MNQVCILIILVIIILLLLSLSGLQENLNTRYKINPIYKPYTSTNSDDNLSTTQYPESVNFKPWYQPWSNNTNKMYCYVNDHLQRRCFWKCDN